MSLQKASISISNAQSISNTIASNSKSITSLSGDPSTFTNNLTSKASSAVGDPISSTLNKTLSRIANTSTLAEKKVDDLTTQLESYIQKNGSIQIINNSIVITVTQQDAKKADVEKHRIESQINSIRGTLNTMSSAISTLQSITSTINVIKSLLDIQEALLTINPISKASYTVLKKGIKILFLRDMLGSYTNVISTQLSQSEANLNQLLSRFMNLQVSINIQASANQGSNISTDQALSNVSQDLLNGNSSTDVDNQSDTFIASNGKTYTLKVTKYGSSQLVAKATDQITGQLAVQTAPSFIKTSDQLLSELKTILNS